MHQPTPQTPISYLDIDLIVHYDFEPGEAENRLEPGCADEAIINSVCVGSVDITNIVGADHLVRIAERIATSHTDDAAAEHADYLIDQMELNAEVTHG